MFEGQTSPVSACWSQTGWSGRTRSPEQGSHETTLIFQEAIRLFIDVCSLLTLWILSGFLTIHLICSDSWETKQSYGDIGRSSLANAGETELRRRAWFLAGQKIAVMCTAELLDKRNP